MRYLLIFLVIYLIGPVLLWLTGKVDLKANFMTADRTSSHIAPNPTTHPEAIVHVYAARAFNWRGLFSVHTWISIKPTNAPYYEVFQVIGCRAFHGLPVM